jgi:alpha-tubulin suppressor-like RCC1 family protein
MRRALRTSILGVALLAGCYDFKVYPGAVDADVPAPMDAADAVAPDIGSSDSGPDSAEAPLIGDDINSDATAVTADGTTDVGEDQGVVDVVAVDVTDAPAMDVRDAPTGTDAPDAPDVTDAANAMDVIDVPALDRPDVPAATETCALTVCSGSCVDMQTDPRHCGACAHDCTALPHVLGAAVRCSLGRCVVPLLACAPGWGDCASEPDDGCETDLSQTDTCGSCATRCVEPAPFCSTSSGGIACTSGCVGGAPTRCGAGCVDTATSTTHCGACGRACTQPANASATCVGGVCGFACNAGRHACAGACVDDAAVATCGTRCSACPSAAHATATCTTGACGLRCDVGFADCNGDAGDGCEVDTRADTAQCGACGQACPAPTNGTAACASGACGFACASGYHRCGTICASNTSLSTCGASCVACAARAHSTVTCDGTACRYTCDAGFADCDGDPTTGCEADTRTSAPNCGGCGRSCDGSNGSASCSAGVCRVTCNAGFGDCDGNTANGCETDTRASAAHCGGCGAPCPAGATCSGSACLATCTSPQSACGLRCVNLDTDLLNCGTCGNVCPVVANASARCGSGACSSHCLLGFGNCDGNAANGCETNLGTSTTSCGRCGHACSTGACSNGICTGEVQLAAGGWTNCARRPTGQVLCWGQGASGQLGNGVLGDSRPNYTPAAVMGVSTAADIGLGKWHVCARMAAGNVQCWGYNTSGQLGNSGTVNSAVPVGADGTQGVYDSIAIRGGVNHTCVIAAGGRGGACFGANARGQLGTGTFLPESGAARLQVPTPVLSLSTGSDFSCAVIGDGSVRCWGVNTYGQLGDGTDTTAPYNVTVQNITDAVQVAAGFDFACAVRANGRVACWGNNASGQLGDGTTMGRAAPVAVLGITDAIAIAAATDLVGWACALRASGGIACWGNNHSGNLGAGYTSTRETSPVAVLGITDAVQVAVGVQHACARRAAGPVLCWGDNSYGQLGSMGANGLMPVVIPGLP